MLNQYIFRNVWGDNMTVSAYDIFDAEKQTIQILRVCDFKGDFNKAVIAYKLGTLSKSE